MKVLLCALVIIGLQVTVFEDRGIAKPSQRLAACKATAKTLKRTTVRRSLSRACTKPKPTPAPTPTPTPTPTPAPAPAPDPTPPPPPPPPPPPTSCPLSTPGSDIALTVSGCTTVASDTASNPDPTPFWGLTECQNSSRHQQYTSGGDASATGSGSAQGDSAFRRLTVMDGDDYWGERCELGYNWAAASDPGTGIEGPGPTVFYKEGMRRATFMSLRLPANWDLTDPHWQTVMQMKQTEPYNDPGNGPVIEMEVIDGRWTLYNSWNELWSVPASAGSWSRFAFDVVYSQDPSKGSIQMHVDLNRDGDVSDAQETSPVFHVATLRREVAGPDTRVPPGESIPSHLRAGLYHDPVIPCPAPSGCHVDVDNVQVVAP